jgi:YD repeat-containing protein
MGKRLSSLSGNRKNISYKYNDSGIRTEKTYNGVTTKYVLEGSKVVYESNAADSIHYTYSANGSLISMNLNGTGYYYIRTDGVIAINSKDLVEMTLKRQ